ncbi:MAG: AraC family transcriptional regulator [Defluviitaleaceae bacterium]|nr:AraC family transcriptional regulator [Defluviitaleaceae bacterium]
MDWLTRMNAAIVYIEENLDGDIDYEAMAKKACCSSHNFTRMFSFVTDVSLSEYIRRRRLTRAAYDLQNSGTKVIDVAVKYGYDSPISFARAFQQLHGVTPSEARNDGATLKAYPQMSFQIQIKGEKEMDYRIETKEAFQIFGIERICKDEETEIVNPGDTHEIALVDDQWEECYENGEFDKLNNAAGELPPFVNGKVSKVHVAFAYKNTKPGTFATMLFAFRGPASNMEGYTVADIPAHTWAIFPSEVHPMNQQDEVVTALNKRIYTEWFPASNYEPVGDLEFELYGGDDQNGYIEVWLPVKKI